MWSAVGQALPQAIAIAISPLPIILVLMILVTDRARTNGPALAIGWVAGILSLTGLATALAAGADVGTDPDAADGGSVVQILLGLLFTVLAVKQWKGRSKPPSDEPPKLLRSIDSMTPAKSLVVGFGAAWANVKNLPLALSAGLELAQATSGGSSTGAVVLFTVIASLGVVVPVLAGLILGDRANEPLNQTKTWMLANSSTIMIVLFTVLAAKMLGSGLAILN